MRWSWPAFAIGALVGGALLFVFVGERTSFLPRDDETPGPTSEAPAPEAEIVVDAPPTEPASIPTLETLVPRAGETASTDLPPTGKLPPLVSEPLNLVFRGEVHHGKITYYVTPPGDGNGAVAELRRQSHRVAERRFAGPKKVTRERVKRWFGSDHGESVMAAIASARRVKPPMVDELIAAVRDPTLGTLRAVALLELQAFVDADARVRPLIIEMAESTDLGLRSAAIDAFDEIGEPGATAAANLLASANLTQDVRDDLGNIVAQSRFVLDHLRRIDDVAGVLAVVAHLPDTPSDELRTALANELPRIVDRLIDDPGFGARAAAVFGRLAALGRFDALADFATDSRAPVAVRTHAATTALAGAAGTADRQDVIVSVLSEPSAPADVTLAVLKGANEDDMGHAAVRNAVWRIADDHTDASIREAARVRLQHLEPADAAGLRIVKATYGKGDTVVDVTAELQRMVTRGKLTVVASNGIAGDPLVGTVKDLIVEYEYGGRTYTRTVREGTTLAIP